MAAPITHPIEKIHDQDSREELFRLRCSLPNVLSSNTEPWSSIIRTTSPLRNDGFNLNLQPNGIIETQDHQRRTLRNINPAIHHLEFCRLKVITSRGLIPTALLHEIPSEIKLISPQESVHYHQHYINVDLYKWSDSEEICTTVMNVVSQVITFPSLEEQKIVRETILSELKWFQLDSKTFFSNALSERFDHQMLRDLYKKAERGMHSKSPTPCISVLLESILNHTHNIHSPHQTAQIKGVFWDVMQQHYPFFNTHQKQIFHQILTGSLCDPDQLPETMNIGYLLHYSNKETQDATNRAIQELEKRLERLENLKQQESSEKDNSHEHSSLRRRLFSHRF